MLLLFRASNEKELTNGSMFGSVCLI